jgi:release factor glutamine methyltransferase
MLSPDVRDYDPILALDGGDTGLAPYETIIPALPHRLKPGGIAAFETGSTQSEAVAALLSAAGFAAPRIENDLAGYGRVVLTHF